MSKTAETKPANKNAEIVMPEKQWRQLATKHARRAQTFTKEHLERRKRGIKHPIEDFLFTYYSYKPANLAKWHPGAGVILENCAERENWRYYKVGDNKQAKINLQQFFETRLETTQYVKTLIENTKNNPARFGCFGLHEWAMVYHLTPEQIRHRGLKLRLGHTGSDQVVETHTITCSHFDAYRFFTPDAVPLNKIQPTREKQAETEQAGCLHAGMDLYKWAIKLGPIIPGELLLDTFELARDIRIVDMQASPYDVTDYGYAPITIENSAGKREYVARQRQFTERSNGLRQRMLEAIALAENSQVAENRKISAYAHTALAANA